MLFQGFSLDTRENITPAWPYHLFNRANNINGIDGDLDGNGEGTEVHTLADPRVTALQRRYVEKVIDTVNDLDNVLFEISNEDWETRENTAWQYAMIRHIKAYEAGKPKQHPVIMTSHYHITTPDSDLFESPADGISPGNASYADDPPAANGPWPAAPERCRGGSPRSSPHAPARAR
jgi:hypothetical protein